MLQEIDKEAAMLLYLRRYTNMAAGKQCERTLAI